MKTILFICTGNSCRSQMAEGFAKKMLPEGWKVLSAGTRADGMNKYAIQVMEEIGIDISGQYSKTLNDIKDVSPNVVITLCDNAKKSCPFYPGSVLREDWGLEDPADAVGSDEEILNVYREVRDQIEEGVEKYVLSIGASC